MNELLCGDALETLKRLPDASVDMCLTSPPYYGLRDYGIEGQLGQNQTVDEYVNVLTDVFSEVKRVLKPSGTLWLNLGDTYCGTGDKKNCVDRKYPAGRTGQTKALNRRVDGVKPKDMLGIPWLVAFALRDTGWYLRSDIVWHKPNCIPEPVKDRCTSSYEHVFLFAKSRTYYYDANAVKEPAQNESGYRNRRDVWSINTQPFQGGHYACFPSKLAETCILAGCPPKGTILDPFMGAGTTALTAKRLGRFFLGIEINPDYITIARSRLESDARGKEEHGQTIDLG